MMLASGLIPASSGWVEIEGRRIVKPYTNLGIVFQQDLLMDWRRCLETSSCRRNFTACGQAISNPVRSSS